MEIENKLDEDFLFYLGFTTSFFHRLPDSEDVEKCRKWMQRLIGEPCLGVEQKRCRNIFLSNLVLSMQEGKLTGPFVQPPGEVDLADACKFFGPVKTDVEQPEWLDDVVEGGGGSDGDREEPFRDDGRTYVATRALPGGEGSFAYVAVSIADEEPKWIGGGEGVFEAKLQEKFQEYVPAQTEMEKILARRKDPRERQRVLTFYDVLIQNIDDELDGVLEPNDNNTINGLIEQLMNDLRSKGEFDKYEHMNEKEMRQELLLKLHERLISRREKVRKREEVLDDIEASLPKSFFDASILHEDRYELPQAMWEQAINKTPGKKTLKDLQENYPVQVNEKFLDLLANAKEEIAMRIQKRHDNIVTQMRKELRREGEGLTKWVEEARISCEQAVDILNDIRQARKAQMESEAKLVRRKKGGETEKTELYEAMRTALFDQQHHVEEEAELGRALTEQINTLNAQSEIYQKVTEESLLKTEEANIHIMKNIKRLRTAVQQHETRLLQIQAMVANRKKISADEKKNQEFFFF